MRIVGFFCLRFLYRRYPGPDCSKSEALSGTDKQERGLEAHQPRCSSDGGIIHRCSALSNWVTLDYSPQVEACSKLTSPSSSLLLFSSITDSFSHPSSSSSPSLCGAPRALSGLRYDMIPARATITQQCGRIVAASGATPPSEQHHHPTVSSLLPSSPPRSIRSPGSLWLRLPPPPPPPNKKERLLAFLVVLSLPPPLIHN